jgi:hypothetical protein
MACACITRTFEASALVGSGGILLLIFKHCTVLVAFLILLARMRTASVGVFGIPRACTVRETCIGRRLHVSIYTYLFYRLRRGSNGSNEQIAERSTKLHPISSIQYCPVLTPKPSPLSTIFVQFRHVPRGHGTHWTSHTIRSEIQSPDGDIVSVKDPPTTPAPTSAAR